MNWSRGLNRIFGVLCILWASYFLYFLLLRPIERQQELATSSYELSVGIADEAYRQFGGEQHHEQALANAKEQFNKQWAEASFTRNWNSLASEVFAHPLLETLYFLLFLVVLPAFVYAVAYGLIVLALWIARGFKKPGHS